MSMIVHDFKYVAGKNDAEYIKLLEDALDRQRKITGKAISRIRELTKSAAPVTNGDRIRGKSDYEMADWIADILNHCDNKDRGEDCLESCPLYACCNLPFDNIEAWLKSPVEVDNG